MRYRYALQICATDMRYRYALQICATDMRYRYALEVFLAGKLDKYKEGTVERSWSQRINAKTKHKH
jgi:hypothetical protein